MILKMARDRTEDGRDVKKDAVIGRLITESNELHVEDMGDILRPTGRKKSIKLPRAPALDRLE